MGFLVLWREGLRSRPSLGEPGYRELRSVFQLSPLSGQSPGQFYLYCVNAVDFVVPGTRRKDPGWKMEWVIVTGNWGATVRCGHREQPVPTAFVPQPEWAKEEDDAEVMDYLTAIKDSGYKYPGDRKSVV